MESKFLTFRQAPISKKQEPVRVYQILQKETAMLIRKIRQENLHKFSLEEGHSLLAKLSEKKNKKNNKFMIPI